MAQSPKVRLALDSLHRGHDLFMPLAGDSRRRLFREVSNARLEMNPELRAEEEVHE